MKWNQWYSILCIAGIRSQSSISVTSSFWGTLSDELQHGTGSPHAIPNQQDCPLCPVLSSFRWLHQWGFHLREDLSDFFKFINVLPKFSHALILSWITRWFSNSELFSAVLAHQSQHPNMQLFSVGPSLFQEDFALTLYWPYTSLVVLVFFGCLLSQLGDIYSTASSDSVRFGLLPTMSRFVHIPLSPSHPEDWLSFVKCFTGIALYPAPSFSLVFTGSLLHSPGYGERTLLLLPHLMGNSETFWLTSDWSMSHVCAKLSQCDVQRCLLDQYVTPQKVSHLYFHTNTLCEIW